MRRFTWKGCCLGLVFLALGGCQSQTARFQPPKLVEEFAIPPADDPRFHDPHYTYPKSSLNQFEEKKDDKFTPPQGPGPGMQLPNRFGPTPGGA
jgi:hypothetical protein